MKKLLLHVFVMAWLLVAYDNIAQAQKKLDLDDVNIKGELLNDGRMRMHAREPAVIDDRVKYRKDFRDEILETYERQNQKASVGN